MTDMRDHDAAKASQLDDVMDFGSESPKSMTLAHYGAVDRLAEALYRDLLRPAGIIPPNFIATTTRSVEGSTEREEWLRKGVAAYSLPISRARYVDPEQVALAIIENLTQLALGKKRAYLSKPVVKALKRVGVDTVAIEGAALNKYRGGDGARTVIAPVGPLRDWLDRADPELFSFFLAVLAEEEKPKPVETNNDHEGESDEPQADERTNAGLDSTQRDLANKTLELAREEKAAAEAKKRAEKEARRDDRIAVLRQEKVDLKQLVQNQSDYIEHVLRRNKSLKERAEVLAARD